MPEPGNHHRPIYRIRSSRSTDSVPVNRPSTKSSGTRCSAKDGADGHPVAERARVCAALPGIGRVFSGRLVRSGNRDSNAGRSGVGAARVAVVVMLDATAEEISA